MSDDYTIRHIHCPYCMSDYWANWRSVKKCQYCKSVFVWSAEDYTETVEATQPLVEQVRRGRVL
jgi:hypothetical protein